jgi:hypothetical protein
MSEKGIGGKILKWILEKCVELMLCAVLGSVTGFCKYSVSPSRLINT